MTGIVRLFFHQDKRFPHLADEDLGNIVSSFTSPITAFVVKVDGTLRQDAYNNFAHDPLFLIFRFSQEEKDDLRECEVVCYQYQGEICSTPIKLLVDHISGVIIFNDETMVHIKTRTITYPEISISFKDDMVFNGFLKFLEPEAPENVAVEEV